MAQPPGPGPSVRAQPVPGELYHVEPHQLQYGHGPSDQNPVLARTRGAVPGSIAALISTIKRTVLIAKVEIVNTASSNTNGAILRTTHQSLNPPKSDLRHRTLLCRRSGDGFELKISLVGGQHVT